MNRNSVTFVTIIASVLIIFIPLSVTQVGAQTSLVPHWIKHIASFWVKGRISDYEFVSEMKWLVENKVLPVTDLVEEVETPTTLQTIKNVVSLWSKNNLPDSEFLRGVGYLIKNGGLELNQPISSTITSERFAQVSVFNDTKKSVVIDPVFTEAAYSTHKFYAYYAGRCDSRCLTASIHMNMALGYTGSGKGLYTLKSLGYQTVTDVDVDKDPTILSKYDKVIVLHNEYVTQNEFEAITNHPHVVYLYPNALYAKVSYDNLHNTITLVRGHGYPYLTIRNGFNWKLDDSHFEYNKSCINWKFFNVKNGIMLDCYPENDIPSDISLLKTIKDY